MKRRSRAVGPGLVPTGISGPGGSRGGRRAGWPVGGCRAGPWCCAGPCWPWRQVSGGAAGAGAGAPPVLKSPPAHPFGEGREN